MRIPRWLRHAPMSPERRAYEVQNARWLAAFCDTSFRVVEMALVLGVVKYLEEKYKSGAVFSTVLSTFLFVFVQSKAASVLYAAIDNYDFSEMTKQRLAWLVRLLATGIWVVAYVTVNAVAPMIVAHEAE